MGSSFDVASMPEFMIVYENIKKMPKKERQAWIWDKIIYANTIKPIETLEALDQYNPLVTFDNEEELKKLRQHAPHAGLVLRIRVPNTGSMVELSSKFGAHPGEAVDLITEAFSLGLIVEGLSFHVGSQCTNFENYVQALQISSEIIKETETRTGQQDQDPGYRWRFSGEIPSGSKNRPNACKKIRDGNKTVVPAGYADPCRTRKVPCGKCLYGGCKGSGKSIPRWQALLLYQ